TDSVVKDRVEASLKSAKNMNDINVASVNKGVVLLSGKTDSLTHKLMVIERVYTVDGVHRVSSEIETKEN
ncbi:MAG TPA: BON domain-containing protein, partial [Vicinamibacteria bacterium]|nr:BON domain-containing protein [Vicinamibacteria bacterium]